MNGSQQYTWNFNEKEGTALKTQDDHSWFLMLCSWEPEHDAEALKRWAKVFKWLRPDTGKESPTFNDLYVKGLIALNLIGKRKFVIAGQAKSNKPLQELSALITLKSQIKVDVYPASNVFEFGKIMHKAGHIV